MLDNWLLGGPLRSCIEGPFLPHEEQRRVSSLRENHLWKFKDFHFPLPTHLEQLINSLSVAQLTVMLDTYVWSHNKGICLPKSASKFLRIPFNKNQWNWIWTLSCPKKIHILIRKSMHERLPTCQFITFSHPNINDRCPRCNSIETTSHILWDCPWAKVIWLQSPGILPLSFFQLPLKIWLKTNSKLEKTLSES